MNPNIELIEHDNFDKAKQAAADDAANSFSLPLTAVMFQQAGRACFSTGLPMSKLATYVRFDSAVKGTPDPENYTNRPVMPDHVRNITDYLVERDTYVIPAITLNVRDKLRVHTFKTASVLRGAMVVVPANATFYVTDGQHRVKAIEAALYKKPSLANDSVPVTLVVEPDIEQVHQDFADAAQTKPIPPSLLTLYNKQDELSHLTVEITENVALFHNRIEKVGKTVSKRSSNFYTLNHVRMSVGAILTGDSSSNGPALRDLSTTILHGQQNFGRWRTDVQWFFNELSSLIPEWALVRDSNLGNATLGDVEEFRSKYIHFSGTGLAIIGAVGHRVLMLKDQAAREDVLKKMASIDWERADAQGKPNPFWAGTVLLPDGRLVTSRYAVEAAVNRVLQAVGLGVPTQAPAPAPTPVGNP